MPRTAPSASSIVVIVSGGGPVGLTFSLNLAMMMCKRHVKIVIYEGRWLMGNDDVMRWRREDEGNTRRDQVVTLQDHVIQQLPAYVQKGLFVNINERVWPSSRNIPIQEVEDRLLDLIQPFVQSGQVELIAEQLNELSEYLIQGSFDILVGADGANSFVRRYCNIQVMSEGIEYACGVAYKIPANVPPSDQPLHQALNCVLTSAQTRYLVNSSVGRRGYLNVRLVQSEYEELRDCLQTLQGRDEPLRLVEYKECAHTSVWSIIRQGLDFFNIRQKFVHRVVPIEINVRHASIVVRELRFEIKKTSESPTAAAAMRDTTRPRRKKFKTMLACLTGDAAMGVHFWGGRGMNSGMKSAMALARNIFRACAIKMPPHFLDLLGYESFMAGLRAREQQGRSLRILLNPIDECVHEAYTYDQLDHCHVRYTAELNKRLRKARRSLQQLPEWPHQARPVTDKELNDICNRISHHAVAQLSLANPWPTREVKDVEVLVEDTFPFDQQHYLPVPRFGKTTSPQVPVHQHHRHHHHRSLILWIVGDLLSKHTRKLIDTIGNSSKFTHSSSFTSEILSSSPLSSTAPRHALHVVKTIKDAKDWMQTAQIRERVQRREFRFKVITSWSLNDHQTAVDVIRAIRAELPHAPVLVIPNKHADTRPAREFPNVIIIDTVFELYEFLGIDQAAHWDAGYRVSHREQEVPAIDF